MAKWCNQFNCWIDEIEEIIEDVGCMCNVDCEDCECCEDIKPQH